MKCAVASVAIGEEYQSSYAAIFKPSVQRYVAQHGYDLVVLGDYIGGPEYRDPRFATFMKMLVPYHEAVRNYDLLMVIDVDILISAKAPPFHTLDIGTRVGVVDEWCQPNREDKLKFQKANGLEMSPGEYYLSFGFEFRSEILINSGVFVCSPRLHGPFFRDIVERHIEAHRGHPRGQHYEQAMFGYELQTNDLAHLLPVAWNCLWPHYRRTLKWGAAARRDDAAERFADLKRFREVLDGTYLLHMAGGLDHDLAYISRKR